MHDANENPVTAVPDDQLALVGTRGNTVLGADGTVAGTFLGSSDIEGFQAGNFLEILDNGAAQWLSLADDVRRDDARRLREPRGRARVLRYEPPSVATRRDPRDRDAGRERVSAARRSTRSRRPTAICSTSRACSAPIRASIRSPTRPTPRSEEASRRSPTSTAIHSPSKTRLRRALLRSTTARSR